MTENEIKETKEWLQDFIRTFGCNFDDLETRGFNECVMFLKELEQYRTIGTIEEFKDLKEKSVAKKAIGKKEYNEAYCPCCNEVISDGEFWALNEYVHHCNECGQAVKGVDWQ